MNCALSSVFSETRPLALASFPLTTSKVSSSPVARAITRSFEATETGRMGLKKSVAPSRVCVTS